MDNTFLQARIDACKAQIIIYEDALTALGTGNVQTYTLDTGQSRQTVTKLNLTELRNVLDNLYNRCAVLETRLTGSGTGIMRPAW